MGWKWVGRAVLALVGMTVLAVVVAVVFTPIGGRVASWASGEGWNALQPAERATVLGQIRLVTVQIAAALAAASALVYTGRTYHLARRGQVTDRFTKSLERLSSDKSYARIGGVLALERIVKDSPDQGEHAARVLNAFILEHAPKIKPGGLERAGLPTVPSAEVGEALRVLLRSIPATAPTGRPRVDLSGRHLAGARLERSDLRSADLTKAYLAGSSFAGATVAGADFAGADLSGTDFTSAKGLVAAQLEPAASLKDCALPQALMANDTIARRVAGEHGA